MKNRQWQLFVWGLLGVGILSLLGAGWVLFAQRDDVQETAVSSAPSNIPNVEATVNNTAVPPTATAPPPKTVTLIVDGSEQTISTQATTVADLLQEAGIQLNAADRTEPPLDAILQAGTAIQLWRAFTLTIAVDGRTYPMQTTYSDIPNILAAAGFALVGQDYTLPNANTAIQANDTIQIVRVSEEFAFTDTIIPYDTVYQADASMEIDTRAFVTAGSPGILRQQIRTRYENGLPVAENIESAWIAQNVTNELIKYGTNIVIRTINTPQGPLEYWRVVRMKVTGYTAATSGKSRDNPAYGITASGLQAGKGVVAIDPKVVPFRSNIYVEGYGQAVAGDTGGLVKGRIIDLGFDEGAYETWRGQVDVYYLTPLPAPEKINYLIPTTIP